jgi:hypothetical protein
VDSFINITPQDINQRDLTRSIETHQRQLIEKRDRCLDCIHELERRLNIVEPWIRGSDKWLAAQEKLQKRDFRKALDALEGLVVSRLFELSKMNMSQTGALFDITSNKYDAQYYM